MSVVIVIVTAITTHQRTEEGTSTPGMKRISIDVVMTPCWYTTRSTFAATVSTTQIGSVIGTVTSPPAVAHGNQFFVSIEVNPWPFSTRNQIGVRVDRTGNATSVCDWARVVMLSVIVY